VRVTGRSVRGIGGVVRCSAVLALLATACPSDDAETSASPTTESTTTDSGTTAGTDAPTSSTSDSGGTTSMGTTEGSTTTDGTTQTGSASTTVGPTTDDTETGTGDDSSTELDRVTDGLAVLYRFDAGGGTVIQDVSGVGSPLNLTMSSASSATWEANSLVVTAGMRLTATEAPTKIVSACQSSSAVTIELWVRSQSAAQSGVVLSLSTVGETRAFSVAQSAGQWEFRINTSNQTSDGFPAVLVTADVETMSHVVFTRAGTTMLVYLDGTEVDSSSRMGNFNSWPADLGFALVNDLDNLAPFLGELGLAAVYCRALDAGEVTQNYEAGY
jgi:hypothetical protein